MRSSPAKASLLLVATLAIAACTNTQGVLEPAALVSPASPAQAQFPIANQPATDSPTLVAAVQSNARIQFAPVIGATSDASNSLASRIATRAGARGINLAGANDSSATHVMKGYFSAIAEGGETTVIYVWDVVDHAGSRVHRVQGQAKSPGGAGWPSVQPATMEAIADQTIEQLVIWLANGQV
jgi:hypothetical protein